MQHDHYCWPRTNHLAPSPLPSLPCSVFELAARDMDLSPGQLVHVGDDAVADVGGAKSAGCRGLLVQTGKYRDGDEAAHEGIVPDGLLPSVAALPAWLAAHNAACGGGGGLAGAVAA